MSSWGLSAMTLACLWQLQVASHRGGEHRAAWWGWAARLAHPSWCRRPRPGPRWQPLQEPVWQGRLMGKEPSLLESCPQPGRGGMLLGGHADRQVRPR